MRLFRKSQLEDLAVTMAGVKLGDRVLLAACRDPKLVAALAAKTGLTGRACAVDESPTRTEEAARIAQAEGALIETITAPLSALPLEGAAFDLVVFRDVLTDIAEDERLDIGREAARVLRPGGRCLVVETTARRGVARLLGAGASKAEVADDVTRALERARFRGVRTLAEREGRLFVEGVKPAAP